MTKLLHAVAMAMKHPDAKQDYKTFIASWNVEMRKHDTERQTIKVWKFVWQFLKVINITFSQPVVDCSS